MWILLVLLSSSLWALDSFERLKNVKIIRVLPNNIIQLDRGIEDGIMRDDHIKLSNEVEGYVGRGLCVKAASNTSYWQLYRLPKPEAFSKDYTYTIEGYADRELPNNMAKLRGIEAEIKEEEKKKDPGPDPFAVKQDLPERLTERDLIEATGPAQKKLFIEQAFNEDQLRRDLTDYKFSVYASPFMKQSINNGESLRYGFRGGNIASKYRLLTQFEQQQTKLKDPLTTESVSTRSTNGQAQFIIHQLKAGMSSLSIINYNSTRFSRIGTPKNHWQVGPVGFTWHLHESKTWEYMDLSYVPLYDIRETETFNPLNGRVSSEKKNGVRHGFRFGMKSRINERVAFENLTWVRPFQDISTWKLESDNLNFVNDLKLVFNLSGNLFFDYNLIYQKDKLWKTLNGLPETNIINSINVRYDFDI